MLQEIMYGVAMGDHFYLMFVQFIIFNVATYNFGCFNRSTSMLQTLFLHIIILSECCTRYGAHVMMKILFLYLVNFQCCDNRASTSGR